MTKCHIWNHRHTNKEESQGRNYPGAVSKMNVKKIAFGNKEHTTDKKIEKITVRLKPALVT